MYRAWSSTRASGRVPPVRRMGAPLAPPERGVQIGLPLLALAGAVPFVGEARHQRVARHDLVHEPDDRVPDAHDPVIEADGVPRVLEDLGDPRRGGRVGGAVAQERGLQLRSHAAAALWAPRRPGSLRP